MLRASGFFSVAHSFPEVAPLTFLRRPSGTPSRAMSGMVQRIANCAKPGDIRDSPQFCSAHSARTLRKDLEHDANLAGSTIRVLIQIQVSFRLFIYVRVRAIFRDLLYPPADLQVTVRIPGVHDGESNPW